MKKASYISKLFFILSILLIIVAILMAISIYRYSKLAISNEIIDLNKVVLSQLAEDVSWAIEDSIELCNKIANDSSLLEILSQKTLDTEAESSMQAIVQEISTDHIWAGRRQKRLLEVYLMGFNGANYFSPGANLTTEKLYKDFKSYKIPDMKGEAVLINTVENPEAKGLYKYSFQVMKEVRDHISQEPYGFVTINVSENALYGAYDRLTGDNRQIFIMDENNNILSSKNKTLIGEKYLAMGKTLSDLGKPTGQLIKEDKTDPAIIFFHRIQGSQWYLVEEMSMDEMGGPLKSVGRFIFLVTLICIGLFIFLSNYFAKKIAGPIAEIRNNMEEVTHGDLSVRASVTNNDEFGHIARAFNEMVEQIEYLLDTVKREEGKKRLAELDFLRAQINPHFIYNTLSSIRFYIEMNKNKEAEEMLYYFSRILRNSLSRSDEFLTLEDELKTIKDYVELQKLRYTDGFHVTYDVAEDILDIMIPSFILQPIVENSIFYSVGRQDTGQIHIKGWEEEGKVKIIIADNGIGMDKKQIDEAFNKEIQVNKVGLINVHERIQLNYGREYGLDILSQDGQGTQVIFSLPSDKGQLRKAEL